jgi:hypothetical protein
MCTQYIRVVRTYNIELNIIVVFIIYKLILNFSEEFERAMVGRRYIPELVQDILYNVFIILGFCKVQLYHRLSQLKALG